MAEPESVPQEAPAAPAAPKSAEPGESTQPPEPQGFPWIRALAGVMLAALVVAAIVWIRRPDDLTLSARFEPASPAPGEKARLFLKVGPGPALAGAELRKIRAEVLPPAGLAFDRNVENLLPGEEEMTLGFLVDKAAKPGQRRLVVLVSARLPAGGGRSVEKTVGLRRELELVVR